MYRYETHLHTHPVSKCARSSVREQLEFYKKMGYDGVFITNHFLDGNIGQCDGTYEDQLDFYFSDYKEALRISEEIGIKAFLGVEISYKGTDFLIYGLDEDWYYAHPEIMDMKKSLELCYLIENGALVIHAHPYREANYINHIRLFPRAVHGVEVYNACRTEGENEMANVYAKHYGLIPFAGTDNHCCREMRRLTGMSSVRPIYSEQDFVQAVLNHEMYIFTKEIERSE